MGFNTLQVHPALSRFAMLVRARVGRKPSELSAEIEISIPSPVQFDLTIKIMGRGAGQISTSRQLIRLPPFNDDATWPPAFTLGVATSSLTNSSIPISAYSEAASGLFVHSCRSFIPLQSKMNFE